MSWFKRKHDPIMYRIGKLAAHSLPFNALERRMEEASRSLSYVSIWQNILFDTPLKYYDQLEPSQMLEGMRKVYEERREKLEKSLSKKR